MGGCNSNVYEPASERSSKGTLLGVADGTPKSMKGREELEGLRWQAREDLLKSLKDGTLADAIRKTATPAAVELPPPADEATEHDVRIEEVAPEAVDAKLMESNAADESKSAEALKVEEAPPAEEPKPVEQSTLARWTERLQRSMGSTKEGLERKPEEEVNRAEEVASAEKPPLTEEANAAEKARASEQRSFEKGDPVKVWTNTEKTWCDGIVDEIWKTDDLYDGKHVKRGTVFVKIVSGEKFTTAKGGKFVLAAEIDTLLRHVDANKTILAKVEETKFAVEEPRNETKPTEVEETKFADAEDPTNETKLASVEESVPEETAVAERLNPVEDSNLAGWRQSLRRSLGWTRERLLWVRRPDEMTSAEEATPAQEELVVAASSASEVDDNSP